MTFCSVWGDSYVTKMRVTSALQLLYIYIPIAIYMRKRVCMADYNYI